MTAVVNNVPRATSAIMVTIRSFLILFLSQFIFLSYSYSVTFEVVGDSVVIEFLSVGFNVV